MNETCPICQETIGPGTFLEGLNHLALHPTSSGKYLAQLRKTIPKVSRARPEFRFRVTEEMFQQIHQVVPAGKALQEVGTRLFRKWLENPIIPAWMPTQPPLGAQMPRGRSPGPPMRELRFRIPEEMFARIQLILMDTMTEKMEYGKLSTIGQRLFREWLERVAQTGDPNA